MKHSDIRAFAINGIIFLIAGGFLSGIAIAREAWVLLVVGVPFIAIGVICVMAVAESAREKHRER